MNEADWTKAVAFHGHQCPGLAIGFRAVDAARTRLGADASADEDLVCVTENDACGVDAVQALLSCTFGKGNLIYRPTGKQAFTFYDRASGKSIRAYLKAHNSEQVSREEWQRQLLSLPLDEVFEFSVPVHELPEKARIFTTITCSECGEGAPEHMMRLQDSEPVCRDCFRAYDRGW